MGTRKVLVLLGLISGAMLQAGALLAENYPTRPIRMIVAWPPGGIADTGARRLAAGMEGILGQQVIVENKVGASGQIAAQAVARAAPDGYTLMRGDLVTHAINVAVFPKLAYDPVKDFVPVSLNGRAPMLLVVNAALGVNSVKEFIALSKSKPGGLNYASPSVGTPGHLATELFKQTTGAALNAVSYKGEALGIIDVVSGEVPAMFAFPATALPHLQSSKLKALCLTYSQRVAMLPDVPTVHEVGLPEMEFMSWGAVFAPAGTPRSVVERLNRAVVKAMEDPKLQEQLRAVGTEPVTSSPDELAAFMRTEIVRLSDVVKRAGIRLE